MTFDDETTPERVLADHSLDALDRIRRAIEAKTVATEALREAVAAARALKVPWNEIAELLGVRRQSAQERFGGGTAKDHVIRAWDVIERELWKIAAELGMPGKPLAALQQLLAEGRLDADFAEPAERLFKARVSAVHDPRFLLSDDEADRLTDVVISLRAALLLARRH